MPFQKILQEILTLEGAEAVVFLDSEGETIFACGNREADKLKLFGAYQSILLKSEFGQCRTIFTFYDHKGVLTHHLKDGYFLSVLFSQDTLLSRAQFRLQDYYDRIEREL